MHVLFVRHGQTEENAAGILQGHRQTSLNDVGRRQAMRVAGRLATWSPNVEAIVSSDLDRALDTATTIARAVGLAVDVDADWRERAFGDLEGRTIGEANIWRAAAGEDADPPGGEPMRAFDARVERALTRIPQRFDRLATVVVVTHGGPVRALLRFLASGRCLLANGQSPPVAVPIVNASILHLETDPRATETTWRIHAINDAAHLTDVLTDRDAG